MASRTGEQSSSRTTPDERPRPTRQVPVPADPLERLRNPSPVPPSVDVSDTSAVEAESGRPAPIVRLPSPPKAPVAPAAGESGPPLSAGGADDVVADDDRTQQPESGAGASGQVDRTGDGGARPVAGAGWGVDGMPAWLSGAPPVAPAPPRSRATDPHGDGRNGFTSGTDDFSADDWGSDRWGGRDQDWEWEDDDQPDGRSRSRFAVAPPAAIALILVGVIACVIAGFTLWRSDTPAPVVNFPEAAQGTSTAVHQQPEDTSPTAGRSAVPPSNSTAPPSHSMVVSVVGLVARPGLVRLPSGARVAEAIERAGGVRKNADLLSLNLAQVLRDGDQVLVGYAGRSGGMSMRSAVVGPGSGGTPSSAGDSTVPSPAGGDAPSSGSGTVNLNTASQTELESLPGVGPVTAKSILDWRQRNGRFTSVDQLTEVDGIGPARLEKLRDKVTV